MKLGTPLMVRMTLLLVVALFLAHCSGGGSTRRHSNRSTVKSKPPAGPGETTGMDASGVPNGTDSSTGSDDPEGQDPGPGPNSGPDGGPNADPGSTVSGPIVPGSGLGLGGGLGTPEQTGEVGTNYGPIKQQTIDYVHQFLSSQLVKATYKGIDYNAVATYRVSETHENVGIRLFYKLADTYDNALAAIFWTEMGKPIEAKALLDTFIRLMGLQGYRPTLATPAERTAVLKMLAARYDFKKSDRIGVAPEPSDSNVEDTGNNAYLGLAFCKFANKYHNQLDSSGPIYRNAAMDLLTRIDTKRKCADGKGYRGRTDSDRLTATTENWVSIEHNVDVYALATCLKKNAQGSEGDFLTSVANTSQAFVTNMYDPERKVYFSGAASCGEAMNKNVAVPADAQTWRYLADSDLASDAPARAEASLAAIVGPSFFTSDTDLPGGCVMNPPAGSSGVQACSALAENQLLFGTKFSDRGHGAQIENTAAAYFALARFLDQNKTSAAIDRNNFERVRRTLVTLLLKNKEQGLPASFREQPITVGSGTVYNTGFSWDYFRVSHVASSVWTALALAYKFNADDTADAGFNPYSAESSRTVYPATTKIEALRANTVVSSPCPQPNPYWYDKFSEFGVCHRFGEVVDSISAYCSSLATSPQVDSDDSWFDWRLNEDRHLRGAGLNRSSIGKLCGQPELMGCNSQELLNILRYVWYKYSNSCVKLGHSREDYDD